MKLAIVSLSTFGYFERMAEAATRRGVPAVFFDERPANDVWTKLVLRVAPKRFGRWLARRHVSAQRQRIVDEGFTHVLLVFAETYAAPDLDFLKCAGLRTSRFTWDSLQNRSNVAALDPYMEAIGSFDPEDCGAYGYTYIPLYSEEIVPEAVQPKEKRPIDFYFCGTTHTDRAALIHQIEEIASKRGWQTDFKLFYHSRLLYALRHWRDKRALALYQKIREKPFPHAETLDDSRHAKVVIDIHHAKQSGLTMRSFEALAQGAVLLTTNRRASELMDPGLRERVVYLDRGALEASMAEAVSRHAGPLEPHQYESLSLDRFLNQIFDLLGLTPGEKPA